MPNSREMLKKYLADHGYDGLYNGNCGCGINDFAPCDEGPFPECAAALSMIIPPDGIARYAGEIIHYDDIIGPGDTVFFEVDLGDQK